MAFAGRTWDTGHTSVMQSLGTQKKWFYFEVLARVVYWTSSFVFLNYGGELRIISNSWGSRTHNTNSEVSACILDQQTRREPTLPPQSICVPHRLVATVGEGRPFKLDSLCVCWLLEDAGADLHICVIFTNTLYLFLCKLSLYFEVLVV